MPTRMQEKELNGTVMCKTVAFHCPHIGVAKTTEVFTRQNVTRGMTPKGMGEYSQWEARVGIAIAGSGAGDSKDPFAKDFDHNYAVGKGDTEQEAIDKMNEEIQSTARII